MFLVVLKNLQWEKSTTHSCILFHCFGRQAVFLIFSLNPSAISYAGWVMAPWKSKFFSSTETTEVSVARHPLSCGYHAESQRHSKISQKRGLQKFCMILRPQQDRNCFALHRSLWIFQSHASYRKVAVSEGKTENENHYCLKLQNLKVIFLIPFSDPHPDSNNLFPSKLWKACNKALLYSKFLY